MSLQSGYTSGSLKGCTISLLGIILSSEIVTMPYAFKLVGIIPGILLLILGSYISSFTSKKLV